ncbi:MAG: tellurite resistance TerB family protein [Chloracidobacterium sp.]
MEDNVSEANVLDAPLPDAPTDDLPFSGFPRPQLLAFVRGVANIVAADGKVTESEKAMLYGLVRQTGLSILDEDVRSAIEAELAGPSPIEKVIQPVTDPLLRRALYQTCVEVALSDGHLADVERLKLVEVASLFGLNSDAARDFIQWTLDSIAVERRGAEIISKL